MKVSFPFLFIFSQVAFAGPLTFNAFKTGNATNSEVEAFTLEGYEVSENGVHIERTDGSFKVTSSLVLKTDASGKENFGPYEGSETTHFGTLFDFDVKDIRFGASNLAVWFGKTVDMVKGHGHLKESKMDITVYSHCKDMLNAYYAPAKNLICVGHLYETLGRNELNGMASLSWDADVLVHELAHGIFHHVGNLKGNPFFSFGSDLLGAMNEGQADFFSYAISGNVGMAPWMMTLAKAYYKAKIPQVYERVKDKKALRDLNNTFNFAKDYFGEIHSDGRIFAGVLYDVSKVIGVDKTVKLWLHAITKISPADNFYDYAQHMIEGDKEFFAGENYFELVRVFQNRGVMGNDSITDGEVVVRGMVIDDKKILNKMLKVLGVSETKIQTILKNNNDNNIFEKNECVSIEMIFRNGDHRDFVGTEMFVPTHLFPKGIKSLLQNRYYIGNLKSGKTFPKKIQAAQKRRPWLFVCSDDEVKDKVFSVYLKNSSDGIKKVDVPFNNIKQTIDPIVGEEN